MSSEPYDPYIPAGQGASGAPKDPNARTAQIQQQIDGTIGVMRDNINKFAERGAGLQNLQQKTGDLADSANDFRRGANQVRKKMWWKDMKMRIWLGIGIVVLLAIIIIPSVLATRGK